MKIKKIEVKNFRLLKDISIVLENDITLIVGRNNSGKTSLTEIFCKFFESVNNKFRFEDFSISCHNEFVKSYMLYKEYEESKLNQESEDILLKKENVYKEILPSIILAIQIEYTEEDDLTSLSNFIMDLDPERKDVYIQCSYSVKDPEKLIKVFEKHQKENNIDILNFIKKNYHHFYDQKIYAIDIENIINKFEIEKRSDIEDVFTSGFIFAQRQLDDQYTDNHKRLSKGFEDFYKLNKDLKESDIRKIEISLNDVSFDIDTQYLSLFESIFDDLASFGVREGINLQKLSIKSIFDSDKVLKGNARLFYQPTGIDHLLPEGYNGLGYSNLIFIILQFISFYEAYDKRRPRPAFQLLFIEEPEAHLHPQMQYVFIKNIRDFVRSKLNWDVQILITTHSSHIIAESNFDSIRYFDNSELFLKVKNLSEFRLIEGASDPTGISFLKQYLSLSRCDMFFADKIIMIEGTVERLLLPLFIKKAAPALLSKYISIIEVGGAYAHIFKDLLCFLNIKTLIITDLDSIDKSTKKSCKVSEGHKTSNAVLKEWIPAMEMLNDLQNCSDEGKTKGKIRVAYQVAEINRITCGRSFEEAFILRNSKILECCTNGKLIPLLFKNTGEQEIVENSYEISSKISERKTDFAFDIMVLDRWEVPRYISEGLQWLTED